MIQVLDLIPNRVDSIDAEDYLRKYSSSQAFWNHLTTEFDLKLFRRSSFQDNRSMPFSFFTDEHSLMEAITKLNP